MDAAYSCDCLVNATVESAIVLFNLALVYHVKGLEEEEEEGVLDIQSQSRLQKAQSLYGKARKLLNEAGVPPHTSLGHPVIDILSMAIYNNLGQSAYVLSDYDVAQRHFEDLVRYASNVRTDHTMQQDDETISLLEWHKSVFLVNAYTLQPPKLAPAA